MQAPIRRVIDGLEFRDGLFEAAIPASREVQRLSPNDPRRRVKELRPDGAPFESWVNDSSALRGVQRSPPNDSRKGSKSRALTALRRVLGQ